MEEAIEIKISEIKIENHQPKAAVFLSMMHSPKRKAINGYMYIYAHTYVHTHMHVCT